MYFCIGNNKDMTLNIILGFLGGLGGTETILIIAVLLVVALASLYLIYILNQVQENKLILNKKLALLGMIYFFIHAFFFDSLIWSYNFF